MDLAGSFAAVAPSDRRGLARHALAGAPLTWWRSPMPLAESLLESIARVAFRSQGLPPPELQVYVGGENGIVGRVDFLWRKYRTIAEVDGAKKYDSRSEAMYQLRRDARLRDAGFEVVHFDWREITQMPAEVAASIRAAFQRGSQRRSPGSVA